MGNGAGSYDSSLQHPMVTWFAIALGGALGAIVRYWVSSLVAGSRLPDFPVDTLLVNLIGSLLLGMLFVLFTERPQIAVGWQPLLSIGFLGAMTTFSTFSLDGLLLLQQGHYPTALLYILGSVLLCLCAACTGLWLARALMV